MDKKKPFDINQTWLQCIGCGQKQDLLDERMFKCPNCDNLFEVGHDFSLLKMRSDLFRAVFEGRANSVSSCIGPSWSRSGIWRYKELIMPYLPEKDIITLGEGIVPIIPAGKNLLKWIGGDIDLWLILEGMTPTGSFKDFGMTVMISVAKTAGIEAVVCASTGDTSASVAAYAAAAGMKCAVVLPKGKVTAVQLAQPLVHGAMVITIPGDFDACMKVVWDLVENYKAYPANSLNSSRIEGHQATMFQIAQFLHWELPDWIALPVGNGSNCSSIAKGLRTLKEVSLVDPNLFENRAKILGCQSRAANPLSRSWPADLIPYYKMIDRLSAWQVIYQPMEVGETTATAALIGDPVSWEKVMRGVVASNGTMTTSNEQDLNEAVAVCGKDGIFVCP